MLKNKSIGKVKLVLTGLAMVLMCSNVLMWASIPDPLKLQPELQIENAIHDIGDTTARQEWNVPFILRNVGTRRLVIHELNPSGCCGNAILRTLTIPPGRRIEVTVRMDTRQSVGSVESKAVFDCNDPIVRDFTLTARAFVLSN